MLNPYLAETYRARRSGDSWGDCMAFRFAICDELTWRGDDVPSAWRYRSGIAGVPSAEDAAEEDGGLRLDLGSATSADLIDFGNALARLAAILEARGKSY